MLVGFYQIIIAIENTYNVDPIPDNYISALVPFQFLSFDWSALVYPSSCLSGGFKARLLLVCIGPLLFMLGLAILPIVGALVSALVVPVMAEVSATIKRTTSSVRSPGRKTSRRSLASSQLSLGMAVLFGWIPFVLLVIFSFLPAVTNTIFATWSCDRFEASAGESVYFMNRDLSVQCDTDEHDQIKAVAWYMIAIWPVGMQLLWAGLLFSNRKVLLQPTMTNALKKATAFLTGGYKPEYYYWESVDLLRRLSCTGWVLLISQQASFVRIVVALAASLTVLLWVTVAFPYRREEDNWLAMANQAMTVVILFLVALIRVVDARHVIDAEQAKEIIGFDSSALCFAVIIFVTFTFLGATIVSAMYIFSKILKEKMKGSRMENLSQNGVMIGGLGLGLSMAAIGAVVGGLVGGIALGFTFTIVGSVLGAAVFQERTVDRRWSHRHQNHSDTADLGQPAATCSSA